MRKSISAISLTRAITTKKTRNRKMMNDIMFYLRKLLSLAKRVQSNSLFEGAELEDIEQELSDIKEQVDQFEGSI